MIGFRVIVGVCVAVGALGLASCKEEGAGPKAANTESTTQNAGSKAKDAETAQQDAKQQEIKKYNTYVEAANAASKSFADNLADYERSVITPLTEKRPISYFPVANGTTVDRVRTALDKALAMSSPMPAIDPAAKDYAQALEQLSPLSHEFTNYADAKTYLSDQGAMAREKGPAYLAVLRKAVDAGQAFHAAIAKQDLINVKSAFDKEQQGTLAYFNAGVLYRAKSSLPAAEAFFSATDSAEARAAFKANLDEVNKMVIGLDEQTRATDSFSCREVKSQANSFLAAGRTSLSEAETGVYKHTSNLSLNRNMFSLHFNQLIGAFNRGGCVS